METPPAVLLERHEGWAELVLNRPDRRNAIDGPLAAGMLDALDAIRADPSLRAVVLRGAGLADFWPQLVALAAMGATLFALCALRFQRRIA